MSINETNELKFKLPINKINTTQTALHAGTVTERT
jgi:hypothetical protein